MAANYNTLNQQGTSSPYGAGDPYYAESTGFIAPHATASKGISKWVKIGVPVLIIVIIGAVVGGVVGSRKNDSETSGTKGSSNAGGSNGGSGGSNGATGGGGGGAGGAGGSGGGSGRFATATDSQFLVPIYPTSTNTAAFSSPTFNPSSKLAWPADPFKPSNPSATTVRPDHPRIIAPQYKWDALSTLIQSDPYMRGWNDTIFGNATSYMPLAPVEYVEDGSSGILDVARAIKMRVKAFAYVYRSTKDSRWVDRTWEELQNAMGQGTQSFGSNANDRWNNGHFLDTAEIASAFGIAYDWLHDMWSEDQKAAMRSAMIQYALRPGLASLTTGTSFGWWANDGTTGNWNCVCNGGLSIAALAIIDEDTTGVAQQILGQTVNNAKANCAQAVASDGTWAETANYWYFGTTGHAEMSSALLTATGSDYGLATTNNNYFRTGNYHMAAFGATSLFNYGDHGPNKFSTTANSMFYYASTFNQPRFSLFQREQFDAAEPWSMFWYDPSVSGAFWDQQPLDMFFDDKLDQWASMRTSWTDQNALYVAIKAGSNEDHQTHNDLDVGDFVLDALGTRWAGELGSADYNAPGYFNSGAQEADRWKYYRKMTEGQNTILIDRANQNVKTNPTIKHDSSNTVQGASTAFNVPSDSTAFWTTDMSSAYFQATSVKRGIRLLNGRRQVLLQDEINAQAGVQWRMHTNATVVADGTNADLSLDGQTMKVSILNAPSGATFTTSAAVRFSSDPPPPIPDQENPGVTVLIIDLPAGTYNLQVLFNPQWPGMKDSDFVTPPSVGLDQWSLTSHN